MNSSRWKKGTSGNLAGRPKGSTTAAHLREAIAEHMEEIINALVQQAKAGDVMAAKLLLERAVPVLRPVEPPTPIVINLAGSKAEQSAAIIEAVADGQININQAKELQEAMRLHRLQRQDEGLDIDNLLQF